MVARCRRPLLAVTLAIGVLLSGGPVTGASPGPPLPQLCGYAYPADTRFVVEDGGIDSAGNRLNFCSEYGRHGGPKILGLPISRPFRIGGDVYQAFDFGVLRWRTDTADTVQVDVLDLLHAAGRDPDLLRLGIPPAQQPTPEWLTDPVLDDVYQHSVHPKYGLPTSPPTAMGPYVIQRFQRGLMRRWVERPPTDLPGIVVKAGTQTVKVPLVVKDCNLSLIDTYPWGRIDAACGASAHDQSCTLTDDQLAELESRIHQHMAVTRRDESVVAYWILDDNPGDVRPAIELIHQLVEQENLVDQIPRPTICGFGGDLDDSRQLVAASRAAFDAALANFSPTACDAVALYPYGRTSGSPADESSIDWSMRDLLPYMLQALRDRGWDPERQPLIGIPQTFRFGQTGSPNAIDVEAQTAAYCSGGASAIVFYAWNDSALAPKAELFDAPDLRQGATDGLARCQALWQAA